MSRPFLLHFVEGYEAHHVPLVLEAVQYRLLLEVSVPDDKLSPALNPVKHHEVRSSSPSRGKRGIFQRGADLGFVKELSTLTVQELYNLPEGGQLPCRYSSKLGDVGPEGQLTVISNPQDLHFMLGYQCCLIES